MKVWLLPYLQVEELRRDSRKSMGPEGLVGPWDALDSARPPKAKTGHSAQSSPQSPPP